MKRLSLNRCLNGLLYVTAALMMTSCFRTAKVDSTKNRTVLVYIAADNNLTNIANSNIYSMNSCVSNLMDNDNLLVFSDRMDAPPCLLHIHNFKIDTIAKYPEKDTSDPMVLKEVIDYVLTKWKSECYGLVLWSHGTGWLPTKQMHYVAPNMNYAQSRDGANVRQEVNAERNPFLQTKSFAWENRRGENPPYSCMDLEGLAEAIPDGMFDFILFDACYMGNVEIMYELRNKAEYIISSCFEIVNYGFPYHIVTRDLLNGALIKTCTEFHTYYNSMSGWEKMAGVSLVQTSELDSLARCFKKVVSEYSDTIPKLDVSKIQCFDRFSNHVFYDLLDLVVQLDTEKKYLTEFRLQMERCVPFKISTPYIFPGDREEIPVNSYCGLSVYIPIEKYEASGLNRDYRKLKWSQDTNY